ncbi:MAG TPA: acyl-CoA dehydrogenase family protein [Terriglobales bacterium]|nr:acyl-CoA dehydrogenase family protein [Terriglobales bacterium]
MDFRLSDGQQLLVNTARDFLRRQCPASVMAESVTSERGFSAALWKEISILGWPGLLVPEEHGGSSGSILDVILLIEEMGRVCFPGPYVQSAVVATLLLVTAASSAQRERLLPAMARGDRLCVLALTEESASIDPEAIALEAKPGGTLSGRKLFVNAAHAADDLIVVTRGAGGADLFLLDARRPGVTVLPMEAMAGDRPCEVGFAGVEVRADDLMGEAGSGWERLVPALQAGALARAAEMVGCAQRVLELCVDHAKGRKQFGRPLGSFQAIQHACADLLRDVETARYLVYSAAWKMEQGRECAADVAMAKAYAGRTSQAVARKAHQLLGAISFCEEHSLHLFHKRILAAGLDFGDPSHHLETVASSIGLA